MSTLVEPLRLVLLSESPDWAELLREQLGALGSASPLITAPSWDAASSLFDDHASGLVLATPERLPAAHQCPLPIVLLLEEEPVEEPSGISDWLVRGALSLDVLRRCLRYVREQGSLK